MASVACTFMFTSCSDLLDLYPEDSLSDPKFWTSVQDLELYANGFYGILPGAQGPGADDESDCYVNEKLPVADGEAETGEISVPATILWTATNACKVTRNR